MMTVTEDFGAMPNGRELSAVLTCCVRSVVRVRQYNTAVLKDKQCDDEVAVMQPLTMHTAMQLTGAATVKSSWRANAAAL